MSEPKLSIIIPCYNCEKTLSEAVHSCYQQGLDSFEIILVDDGSKDKTRIVMEDLKQKYDNIRLIFHDENKGGGFTRNVAIENSRAEVIFPLDSDDILPPGMLSKMYDYLDEKKCDGVAFHHSIKFNGNNIEDIKYVDDFSYVGERIPFESLVDSSGILCPLHVVFMFTRDAFLKSGGYPVSHGFDTQGFAWRFLAAGSCAYTCPDTSYFHRVNFHQSYYLRESNNGLINFNWQKILFEHFDFFNSSAQEFIKSFDCSDFTRNLLDELRQRGNILKENYKDIFGKRKDVEIMKNLSDKPIGRNSLKGIFMRLKFKFKKIKKFFKKFPRIINLMRYMRRKFLKSHLIYFLSSSTRPISNYYGLDRGRPIDRFYIDNFLENNRSDIKGKCLELLNNNYTLQYGGVDVIKSDILDIDDTNINATIIDDLRNLKTISDNTYDCIILTQVLQFIDDVDSAISECYRILNSGGVLLVTLPAISRIDCVAGIEGDFWRFTVASAKYLFTNKFDWGSIDITAKGNVRSGIYFYSGLSQEDVSRRSLEKDDPNFPVIITIKAIKK